MAMDFKLKDGEVIRTRKCLKASGTVIEAGDLVAISSGLMIKAVAGSAKLAYCPNGGANGETEIDVTVGNDFTLIGTGDANAAVTDKGIACDLVVNSTNQQVDLGTSSTNVLTVGIGKDSLTAGAATNIEVRIAKPIF
jgi:hypothetical protein